MKPLDLTNIKFGKLTTLVRVENLASSGIVDKGMSALFPDMADSGGLS